MAPPEPHLDVEAPTALKLQKLLTGPRFPVRFRNLAVAAPFFVSDPVRSMANSAVTVLSFEVFQRLTNPWGTPKTTEVVEDRAFCGSDCGSGIKPYLQRRTPSRAVLCDHFLAL